MRWSPRSLPKAVWLLAAAARTSEKIGHCCGSKGLTQPNFHLKGPDFLRWFFASGIFMNFRPSAVGEKMSQSVAAKVSGFNVSGRLALGAPGRWISKGSCPTSMFFWRRGVRLMLWIFSSRHVLYLFFDTIFKKFWKCRTCTVLVVCDIPPGNYIDQFADGKSQCLVIQ